MSSRRRRLSVYLIVLLLSVAMIVKSRTLPERKSAAFMRYTTGCLLVKVTGSNDHDGVYRIIDGKNGPCAKNMTPGAVLYILKNDSSLNSRLATGQAGEVSGGIVRATVARMTAVESILLGSPLDLLEMTTDDWGALPGIGPSLAKEIIIYRQKNGGITSLEELAALPGVGEGKLNKIRSFFR